MAVEIARETRDATVCAVARSELCARELAARLRAAGVAACPETDLDLALSGPSALLVIDPTGWESSCRNTLHTFESRTTPPPAVLFASSDPAVLFNSGPAFGLLGPDLDARDVANHVARALSARAHLASSWPVALDGARGEDLARIEAALESATGLAIRADRRSAFLQALRIRMTAKLAVSASEYAQLLEKRCPGPPEVELLAGLLSVGETYFWRYAGQFRALRAVLLPSLLSSRKVSGGRLRLWSAGCATGEEAYSLAMCCAEALGPEWKVQVVGTDIHRPSLASAEAGRYRARSFRNLPSPLIQKYLEPIPGGAVVSDKIRDRVRFETLNLGSQALVPWVRKNGPFDVIFCRNTLIYFSRSAALRVLDVFEAALVAGGGLFLGASEVLQAPRGTLRSERGPGCYFYAKAAPPKRAAPKREAPEPPVQKPSAVGLYARGLSLLDAEDFSGARSAFQELVCAEPSDARGHLGLAVVLANQGLESEALKHLQRAREGSPELPETHYFLGLLEERSGREAEALLAYQRALAIDPECFMSHFNRAWILRRMGRHDAFRREMSQVLSILGRRPRVLPWLTGGLGLDALLDLAAGALEGCGGAG